MNTTIQDREAASMAEEGVIPALHAALIRYCLSLTGKRQDAEDLAQEAWLKTLAAPQSESHANPQALLLRVARNSWVDQTRRKAVYAKLIDRERTSAAVSTDPLSPMLEQTFHSLLQRLTPRQLAVFLLRDVFGYCVAEAAQLLQLTEGAIKAAHYRARRTLPAVQRDLEQGGLAEPRQEHFKALLRALASCYERGEIANIIQLIQPGDHVSDTDAVSFIRLTGNSRQPEARLAA